MPAANEAGASLGAEEAMLAIREWYERESPMPPIRELEELARQLLAREMRLCPVLVPDQDRVEHRRIEPHDCAIRTRANGRRTAGRTCAGAIRRDLPRGSGRAVAGDAVG